MGEGQEQEENEEITNIESNPPTLANGTQTAGKPKQQQQKAAADKAPKANKNSMDKDEDEGKGATECVDDDKMKYNMLLASF